MTGPAVQQLGAAVLLQGQAVLDARALVRAGVRHVNQADGIATPSRLALLLLALDVAADTVMSAPGHADVRNVADLPSSEPTEALTSQEVAAMLQISARQARRLSDRLDARRVGRAYVYDRAAVQAYAHARRNEDAA